VCVTTALSPRCGWLIPTYRPTAYAVGCILTPLLRLSPGPLLHHAPRNLVLTPTLGGPATSFHRVVRNLVLRQTLRPFPFKTIHVALFDELRWVQRGTVRSTSARLAYE